MCYNFLYISALEVAKLHERIEMPIYAKIALDVAGRIHNGELKEGDRVYGRSVLAGEYNVSPETIRRAMNLLEDMQVIAVGQGSGIFIKSREKAYTFMERFRSKDTIVSLKGQMRKLIAEKQDLDSRIIEIVDKITDYADRLKNVNPINPVEIEIPPGCHLIGQTISEAKFWQNTGATITAISRKGTLIVSPGPYAVFEEDDIIISVGNGDVLERIRKYIEE